MPQTQALPMGDERSEEDTLNPPSARISERELRELLRPKPGSIIAATGTRIVRPADRHITCGASVADAVIEDRG